MIKVSQISCSFENHRKMKYEYVCLNENCLQNNQELCCLYCCEEFHKDHMINITSMKSILSEIEILKGKKGFDLLKILLQGIGNCINFEDLRKNFAEILGYRKNPNRYEDILDQQMKALHKQALKQYQRNQPAKTTQSNSQKSSRLIKEIISPVLTFKEGNGYTLNSPFSITSTKNEITTIHGFPSLSKFYQSTSITLKIDRYTPSWLGIGVSIGQSKYQDKSSKHLLAISNGWVANKGIIQKSNFRFGSGDEIKIRWDKNMELLEFLSPKREKITFKFENNWNQDIYFCVCLFYKGDSVHLLG